MRRQRNKERKRQRKKREIELYIFFETASILSQRVWTDGPILMSYSKEKKYFEAIFISVDHMADSIGVKLLAFVTCIVSVTFFSMVFYDIRSLPFRSM